MAIAKGYWRSATSIFNWDTPHVINGFQVNLRDQYAHNSMFSYNFSVRDKSNEIIINGFIEEQVSHPRSGSFSILRVFHDRNMNGLFDADSKRFPRSTDPLIGKFEIPHSDPWYERAIYHHRGITNVHRHRWLTSSDGIGKAKFKYKIVKTTDDDGNVTGERIKITDMIFKETNPAVANPSAAESAQDLLFTDNILFQANPDL